MHFEIISKEEDAPTKVCLTLSIPELAVLADTLNGLSMRSLASARQNSVFRSQDPPGIFSAHVFAMAGEVAQAFYLATKPPIVTG